MVEFTLSFMLFITLVFGIIDASRALFELNALSRAAVIVAHGLADQYGLVPADISSKTAQPFILQAQQATGVSFSTAEPTTVNNGQSYQELTNYQAATGGVYICGTPNFNVPILSPPASSAVAGVMVIQVTVKATLSPIIGMFIGKRSITLSESATALTVNAEGSSGSTTDSCPSH